MPLYEYQCNACGHRFEIIQKFSDEPVRVCPQCGGEVTKLISSPAIQFKGTGWYITDYARKGQSANGGGEGRKSADSESGAKSAKAEGSAGSGQSSPASDSSSSGSTAATPAASSSKDS